MSKVTIEAVKMMLAKAEGAPRATEKQVAFINDLMASHKVPEDLSVILEAINNDLKQLPAAVASRLIDTLKSSPKRIFVKHPDGMLEEV
ncbi:hypothetical protein [Ferviditalea candida]|uniref:Uncharacterized protein n=1 Tax=Ferviditalea candida TaxID=3108399 RepID=A0ABU5ZP24_9BACL|nr:hypothetical protein [Paenibacillaceae bacterium T2]